MSKIEEKVFGVVLLVFVVLALICFSWGVFKVRNAFASQNWPQTKGEILSSEFKSISKGQDRHSYYPKITYRYSVEESEHESTRIAFHDAGSSDRDLVNSIVERYSKGKEIPVFYNPNQHDVAVLEPGLTVTAGIAGPFIFGIAFLGIAMLKVMPKFMRERRKEESQQNP